jgi:tetratricopeptide (TPR) repeat protein
MPHRLTLWTSIVVVTLAAAGCQPGYHQLRMEGRFALEEGNYAVARDCFERAEKQWPENAVNLFDLGVIAMRYANERARHGNRAAVLRELDTAVWYFSRAIDSHPGMQAALVAKNEALEQKGLFEEALDEARWAMNFVGPSAKSQIFMAREMEERGDWDAALLRYRQGVAIEPENAEAHAALAKFLMRRGKTRQALDHYESAYRLDPREPSYARALTDHGLALPRTAKVDASPSEVTQSAMPPDAE